MLEFARVLRLGLVARFGPVVVLFTLALPSASPLAAQNSLPQQAPAIEPRLLPSDTTAQPSPSLAPEDLGDLMMVRKRYEAAIQAYLQASPKTAEIWNKLGIAYQQMYNTEQARRSYRISLKLNPKNANVINNMGTVYYSLKQYPRAERLYLRALRLDSKSALIYKNLGTNFLAEDQFKKGWECYQAALHIDPTIFERTSQVSIGEPTSAHKIGAMNYFLAKSYLNAGKPQRAVECLRLAIDEGFADRKKILADKEFASLHGDTAFEQLLSEQRLQ